MSYWKNLGLSLLNRLPATEPEVVHEMAREELEEKTNVTSGLPRTRQSIPNTYYELNDLKTGVKILTPSFVRECIPLIRKLYKVNPDLGSALFDIIQLTNTGYEIKFDRSVPDDKADEMRKHIKVASRRWNYGTAGLPGIINKMIAQLYVGGALSNEWVPNRSLTGIESVSFVNPEEIYFSLNRRKTGYDPYQKVKTTFALDRGQKVTDLIELNKNTYKYYGILGDEDVPYGVPPYLTSLDDLDNQSYMKKNIRHIIQQVGLMGFLEILMEKPAQKESESEEAYRARLESLLTQTKANIGTGMIDGVMVGYQEDHEFQFHSTTKSMQGLGEVFGLNESQVANGLKTSGTFIGTKQGGTETSITIIFTKMLSQLKNVQNILSENLEFGLGMELRLAGYSFKEISVTFKPSTITDDLKIQQGKEIKIRNLQALYNQGIISQEQFAYECDYEKPDQKEPRIPLEDPQEGDVVKKKKREDGKNESDKKVRRKNKPQPKRDDQK